MNHVPHCRGLVIEVHRVLRREHRAEPNARACFMSVSSGSFEGGMADAGSSEYLVHVEQRAQARRARLAAHPRHELVRDQRDDEMRSASLKCAMEMMAMRGLPASV